MYRILLLKKSLYTINTVQKNLSYSTSFVSKISKSGASGWRQEEQRGRLAGEGGGRKIPVLFGRCSDFSRGTGGFEIFLTRAHTEGHTTHTHTHTHTHARARTDATRVPAGTHCQVGVPGGRLTPPFPCVSCLGRWGSLERRGPCQRWAQGQIEATRANRVPGCV